jgi:hypothetical protein
MKTSLTKICLGLKARNFMAKAHAGNKNASSINALIPATSPTGYEQHNGRCTMKELTEILRPITMNPDLLMVLRRNRPCEDEE